MKDYSLLQLEEFVRRYTGKSIQGKPFHIVFDGIWEAIRKLINLREQDIALIREQEQELTKFRGGSFIGDNSLGEDAEEIAEVIKEMLEPRIVPIVPPPKERLTGCNQLIKEGLISKIDELMKEFCATTLFSLCECGGETAGGTHSDWCPKASLR